VRPANPSPNDTVLASILFLESLVHVRDALSEIERGIFCRLDLLNVHQRRVGALIAFCALETGDAALGVQTSTDEEKKEQCTARTLSLFAMDEKRKRRK
jgi:hypothetical protein